MKLTLSFLCIFTTWFANAVTINSAMFNSDTNKVEMNISYSGGCSKHSFELVLAGGCLESYPVQCGLTLLETTDKPDFCEAFITQDLELDLPEILFTDNYFNRAFLTIFNSNKHVLSFQLPK